jgi:hypothetical protein
MERISRDMVLMMFQRPVAEALIQMGFDKLSWEDLAKLEGAWVANAGFSSEIKRTGGTGPILAIGSKWGFSKIDEGWRIVKHSPSFTERMVVDPDGNVLQYAHGAPCCAKYRTIVNAEVDGKMRQTVKWPNGKTTYRDFDDKGRIVFEKSMIHEITSTYEGDNHCPKTDHFAGPNLTATFTHDEETGLPLNRTTDMEGDLVQDFVVEGKQYISKSEGGDIVLLDWSKL